MPASRVRIVYQSAVELGAAGAWDARPWEGVWRRGPIKSPHRPGDIKLASMETWTHPGNEPPCTGEPRMLALCSSPLKRNLTLEYLGSGLLSEGGRWEQELPGSGSLLRHHQHVSHRYIQDPGGWSLFTFIYISISSSRVLQDRSHFECLSRTRNT